MLGDEYVDEFDLFLATFDLDGSGGVVYDPMRAAAAGIGGATDEFGTVDPQLGRLIDRVRPDRDGDGEIDAQDVRLGYDDGIIDWLDRYAKVDGRLEFAVSTRRGRPPTSPRARPPTGGASSRGRSARRRSGRRCVSGFPQASCAW